MSDSQDAVQDDDQISAATENLTGPDSSRMNLTSERDFSEMRSSPRKDFPCTQRIAPLHGKGLPLPDEYINVDCKDISCGGVAFYLKRPPGGKYFAIELGPRPMNTLMLAQVIYVRAVEHNDQRMYLVGCKFIKRIED